MADDVEDRVDDGQVGERLREVVEMSATAGFDLPGIQSAVTNALLAIDVALQR
ncbi:hypothetical protein AB0K00_09785 [Dactylosporangium sp. NPDC049525]|uniref:hypothetical protein n=1 Tax=Dactylosporangium sp. NPDC049525 TaxID=3154730 RepID=UPI00343BAC25